MDNRTLRIYDVFGNKELKTDLLNSKNYLQGKQDKNVMN